MAYLRAALSWALSQKLVDKLPSFPKIQRAEKQKVMKGRPITLEEFERMILAVGNVITEPNQNKKRDAAGKPIPLKPDMARIPSWEFLLNGLWLSGLRLGEALELHWTDKTKFRIDLSMRHPMFSYSCGLGEGPQRPDPSNDTRLRRATFGDTRKPAEGIRI